MKYIADFAIDYDSYESDEGDIIEYEESEDVEEISRGTTRPFHKEGFTRYEHGGS